MRVRTVAAAVACLLASGCERDDDPPVAIEVLGEGIAMAILDMDTNLTREGVRRARLRADTAEFIGEQEIRMRPVELTFFDEQGNELSVITGDHGIFNEQTEDMEAWGSVVAVDRRGDQRLETTRLRYTSEDDRLFGDEAFTLYRDNGRTVLRGSSFETDPGLSSILMLDSSGRTEQAPPTRPPPAPDDESTAETADAPPDSVPVEPAVADSVAVPPPDTSAAVSDTSRAARRGS